MREFIMWIVLGAAIATSMCAIASAVVLPEASSQLFGISVALLVAVFALDFWRTR